MTEEENNPLAEQNHPLPRDSAAVQHSAREITALQCQGEENNSTGAICPVKVKVISQRKIEANRANAKRSTGPRTTRGKANSRRNAVSHGLSCTTVLFDPVGRPHDPDLRQLWERLHEKCGSGDATTDALIENAVTEWAHQLQAVKAEQNSSLADTGTGSGSLHRHVGTSHRALLRTLRALQRRLGQAGQVRTAPPLMREE